MRIFVNEPILIVVMKKTLFFLLLISFAFTAFARVEPGDTVFVKTFTFDSISNRRAVFEFPAEQDWERIMMYYTLKCDAATSGDSYPCGEWDYTTYTNVYEHTGVLDSTAYLHPEYTLNNLDFQTFNVCNSEKYHKYEKEYEKSNYSFTTLSEVTIGNGETYPNVGLTTGNKDTKTYLLYNADSLNNGGLLAGDITELKFASTAIEPMIFPMVLKVAQTEIINLSREDVESIEFTTLYEGLFEYDGLGDVELVFIVPFVWDGTSNIVFEISLSNNPNYLLLESENMDYVSELSSFAKDYYLDFENFSYVEVFPSIFTDVVDEITVCCWVYGDPDIQAQDDYLFEAYGINGERQLGVHYPWSNGNIYWDCGNDGSGYDRINKAATESEYEGKWNHMAFVKNTATGMMKIYINGQLWYSESGKTKSIETISRFIIGGSANPAVNRSYDGYIDDFSVWQIELSEAQIQELMYSKLDFVHPEFGNLVAYFDFNESLGSGNLIEDQSNNNADAYFLGELNRKSYEGINRFKVFSEFNYLPVTTFIQGDFTYETNTLTYTDSVLMNQQILMQYENLDFYNIQCIDTALYYNNYELHTDISNITDTTFFTEDYLFSNNDLTYYGDAFEVINTIQLQNYVTPYGINLSLGADGFTWVYDVTDYQKHLQGNVDISSHNTQELLDLTFVFIEGTPVRDVLEFNQVYLGDFGQYNIANDISLTPTKLKRNPDAAMFNVKTRTTGHGMAGSGNCSEFCPTYHNISVEGEQRYEWYNWTSCAGNPVYPQGGTWIFDRAGWCPGSFADTYDWDITDFVSEADSIEIDYGMTQYPVGSGEGNYRVSVQLVQYGEPNFVNSAAIENVLTPNNNDLFNRYNPVCNNPKILIKNNGSDILNSVNIEYGINGDYSYTYQWTGELEFLETEEVALPVIDWREFAESNSFNVRLVSPNETDDEYLPDNNYITEFDAVDIWTDTIMLVMRTNNFGDETHYQILDQQGSIIVDRDELDSNTTYYDTLAYAPGCYEIRIYDDGEDGLDFWYYGGDDGLGYAKLRIPGAQYVKHFESDFGSFINYQFIIPDLSYIINEELNREYFRIYPNPNDGSFKLDLNFDTDFSTQVLIYDMYGRQIFKIAGSEINSNSLDIDLSDLNHGVYFVKVLSGKMNRTSKLVIR